MFISNPHAIPTVNQARLEFQLQFPSSTNEQASVRIPQMVPFQILRSTWRMWTKGYVYLLRSNTTTHYTPESVQCVSNHDDKLTTQLPLKWACMGDAAILIRSLDHAINRQTGRILASTKALRNLWKGTIRAKSSKRNINRRKKGNT